MPKRIPIRAAKKIAEDYQCKQVILVAWDGELVHVVTYGKSVEDCDRAAEGGNFVKKALGWPPDLCKAEPSRVKKLKQKIVDLEEMVREMDGRLRFLSGLTSTEEIIVDK